MLIQAISARSTRRLLGISSLLVLLLTPALLLWRGDAPGNLGGLPSSEAAVGKLPLVFVPSGGEEGSSQAYLAHSAGGSFVFTRQGVSVQLRTGAESADTAGATLSLSFLGASDTGMIEGGAVLPGTVNFFTGDDPLHWRIGLSTYGALTYRGIYPGIDLTYEGSTDTRLGTPLL